MFKKLICILMATLLCLSTLAITPVSAAVAPPAAPNDVVASAGNSQVNLSWSGVPQAVSYNVYQRTASTSYGANPIGTIGTVTGTVYAGTVYNATGLSNGTTYYFTVVASNAGGNSTYSNEVSATPGVGAATINVNTHSVLNTFTHKLFGVNSRYGSSLNQYKLSSNAYGMWDYENDRITTQADEYVGEMKPGVLRFPGGTMANLYEWKKSIGPVENRLPQIHGTSLAATTSEFGLDEAARFSEAHGIELTYMYNMGNGSLQDALDLIEYCNAPNDGSNWNGGTDWASERAANGHPEPYNITKFEMGNEFNLQRAQQYWTQTISNADYESRYALGGQMDFKDDFTKFAPTLSTQLGKIYKVVRDTDWTDAASNSDGKANQVVYFRYRPVVAGSGEVFVNNVKWDIVSTLANAGKVNAVAVDYSKGSITFGDGINGNIPPAGATIRTKYSAIKDGFATMAEGMINFSKAHGLNIEVYSSIHNENFYKAMQGHNTWTGIAIHPYGSAFTYNNINDGLYADNTMFIAEGALDEVKEQLNLLKTYKPDGKAAITEYAIIAYNANNKSWLNSNSHAIYTARSALGFTEIPGISYANRHSLIDTPFSQDATGWGNQGLLSVYLNEGPATTVPNRTLKKITQTPAALVLQMLNTFYGTKAVQTTIDNNPRMQATSTLYPTIPYYPSFIDTGINPKDDNENVSINVLDVHASTDDDGYTYVAVANGSRNQNVSATIKLDETSKLPTAQVMYVDSPTFMSTNDDINPDNVQLVKTGITGIAGKNSITYDFPANTFVIIKVKTQGDLMPEANVSNVVISGPSSVEAGVAYRYEAAVSPVNAKTVSATWKITQGSGIATINARTGRVQANAPGIVKVVASVDGLDSVAYSTMVQANAPLPVAPTGLIATAGDSQVSLNWNSVPQTVSYKVYQGTSTGSYGSTPIAITSVPTYKAVGLSGGTPYYFAVVATNSYGDSIYSYEASAIPTFHRSSSSGSSRSGEVAAPSADLSGSKSMFTAPKLDNSTGKATVQLDTAGLKAAFDSTKADDKGIKTIKVEIPKIDGAKAYEFTLDANFLTAAGAANKIEIKSDIGSVVMPGNMLANTSVEGGKIVSLNIAQADTSKYADDIKEKTGGRPVIDLSVAVDGKTVDYNNPDAPVTVAIPYTPTAEELKNPEHIVVWCIDGSGKAISVPSGKYDASAVVFSTTHFSQYAVAYVFRTFDDTADYAWAKDSIEVIAAKGILNGTTDNTFSPGANITRADFTMILVKSLGLRAKIDSGFSDVKVADYYYESVGIAKALGVANGSGDNKFNPSEEISRQDMMVITARAMKIAGKLTSSGSRENLEAFADKSDVADYAAADISTMVNEGLIEGDTNRVNPLGKTTRAEAAVIMYRVYNK
ncbi:S-layer homology domain-containing protein [Paenibacillus radicis (ex Xue et al. 2023)]|uniref:S-layer homology domain-containing protein n=1 Tax=Paenibacillus radicis (ex Xue et al. 2023) TaxID=2972489 RepID=A0ABT1YMF9_9BACL|nr:S-layer homology domain-containing protein [Paenibacillus radicis (ex Xue et al. 2023)]MCR8633180.1 S-layer homology domain-containing protein [Paenibacillus radicis (ex Xue et al. 2023)]